MENNNYNKVFKFFKNYKKIGYLDVNFDKMEYYIDLTLNNLNISNKKPQKIADCGSGYSFFIPFLACKKKKLNLFMIDDFKSLDSFKTGNNATESEKVEKNFLNRANKVFKKLNIKKINLNFEKEKFKFKKNSIDCITSFHCIEHFHSSPKKFLKECNRVLKPGGTLVLAVPNAVNFRKRISVLFGNTNYYYFDHYWNQMPYYGHVREPTKEELKLFCINSGFVNTKLYGKNFMGIERLVRFFNKIFLSKKLSRSVSNILLKPLELFPGLCTDLHIVCKKK